MLVYDRGRNARGIGDRAYGRGQDNSIRDKDCGAVLFRNGRGVSGTVGDGRCTAGDCANLRCDDSDCCRRARSVLNGSSSNGGSSNGGGADGSGGHRSSWVRGSFHGCGLTRNCTIASREMHMANMATGRCQSSKESKCSDGDGLHFCDWYIFEYRYLSCPI